MPVWIYCAGNVDDDIYGTQTYTSAHQYKHMHAPIRTIDFFSFFRILLEKTKFQIFGKLHTQQRDREREKESRGLEVIK